MRDSSTQPTVGTSDASAEFNGTVFPISSWLFSRHSRRFYALSREHRASSPLKLIINGTFEPESVKQFISACHDLPYTLTPETAADLVVLSRDWDAPYLEKQFTSLVADPAHRRDRLIPTLLSLHSRGAETADFEEILRNSIHEFVGAPALADLPFEILARVINFKNCEDIPFEKVFELAIQLLDRLGPAASVLFITLDVRRLKAEQLSRLMNHRHFLTCFVNESVLTTFLEIVNSSIGQQETVASLQAFRTDLVEKVGTPERLQGRIAELEVTVAALKAQMPDKDDALRQQEAVANLQQFRADLIEKAGTPDGLKKRITELEETVRVLNDKVRDSEAALTQLREKVALRQLHFPVQQGSVTNGILCYLTRRFGGNVHNLGIVNIDSSSIFSTGYDKPNAVEFHVNPETGAEFASSQWEDQWISFDFRERPVLLTGYSIRSRTCGGTNDAGDLKEWVIEVPGAGSDSWQVIDSRSVGDALKPRRTVQTYCLREPRVCASIRLRNAGPTHGQPYFCFSAIEFFGTLIESSG